jgi:hypothetical protein
MIGAARASSTREYQLLGTTTITSTGSQSATIPAGTLYVEIEIWGAGGGGAGRTQVGSRPATLYSAGGGGGGAYSKKTYRTSDIQSGDTLNFTVGAGGAGGVAGIPGTSGTVGGTTTLDTHKRGASTIETFSVSAGGGAGSIACSTICSTASGGVASGGDINTNGGIGDSGAGVFADGADGGDGANGGAGGSGATSVTPAGAGTQPGGGGGGGGGFPTGNRINGAAGADGKVIVRAYG